MVFFQREAADAALLASRAALAAAAGGAGASQQGQLPPPNPYPGLPADPRTAAAATGAVALHYYVDGDANETKVDKSTEHIFCQNFMTAALVDM